MSNAFTDFALLETLQKTLRANNLKKPTEIQQKAIPLLMEGKSVVGIAETGSGKTLSYALPLLHQVKSIELKRMKTRGASQPKAMVLVPTRELGEQVSKVFKIFTHDTRLRVRSVLGGTSFDVAKENVRGEFEILVATPGRLVKMLMQRQLDLSDVEMLVIDEADQMLDEGFIGDARRILGGCQSGCQIGLFSATISPAVQSLIEEVAPQAEVVRTKGSSRVPAQLKTQNIEVVHGKRLPLLEPLLKSNSEGGTLIFTNTREQCDALAVELEALGVGFAIYRGEMDKTERRANLKSFRDGEVRVLISTDLASRGLDVEHISRVINYHMPKFIENYIHRAGRTARAGRPGHVINFVTERDQDIMKLVKAVSN